MNFHREWERFLSALRLLTIWPDGEREGAPLAEGATYFPLVGFLLGGAAVVIGVIFEKLFTPALFPVVAILSLLILSRALQADGLAKTLDSLAGGGTPQERLGGGEKSPLGTIGILSLLGFLLIKVTALSSAPLKDWTAILLSAATLSRWTTTYLSYSEPRMEVGGGLGPTGEVEGWRLAVATGIAALVGGLALHWHGIVLLVILWAGTAAALSYFRRRPGGLTRDACGAVGEAAETLVLLGVLVG